MSSKVFVMKYKMLHGGNGILLPARAIHESHIYSRRSSTEQLHLGKYMRAGRLIIIARTMI